jgi:hypothetical protein
MPLGKQWIFPLSRGLSGKFCYFMQESMMGGDENSQRSVP